MAALWVGPGGCLLIIKRLIFRVLTVVMLIFFIESLIFPPGVWLWWVCVEGFVFFFRPTYSLYPLNLCSSQWFPDFLNKPQICLLSAERCADRAVFTVDGPRWELTPDPVRPRFGLGEKANHPLQLNSPLRFCFFSPSSNTRVAHEISMVQKSTVLTRKEKLTKDNGDHRGNEEKMEKDGLKTKKLNQRSQIRDKVFHLTGFFFPFFVVAVVVWRTSTQYTQQLISAC